MKHINKIHEDLLPLAEPIDKFTTFDRNARIGSVPLIEESLRAHGQYRAIVVNKRDMVILAGNHTFLAAKQLEWDQIAVTYVDVDDDLAKRINVADNRLPEHGGYDEEILAELLEEIAQQGIGELEATGYDQEYLDALVKATQVTDLDELADEVGEPKHDDGWPSITIRVPHPIKAAWTVHLDNHDDDPVKAMAALLEVEVPG